MANNYQFPYSKIIRETGEVIPASDHNRKENQLECVTDALGNYDFAAGSIEFRLQRPGVTGPTGSIGVTGSTGLIGVTGAAGTFNGITNPAAGQLVWDVGSGVITHFIGPGDQAFDFASGANQDLSVSSGASNDLILGARGGTIALNEVGNTTLGATNFTATSIIGALNELRVDVDGVGGTLAETLAFGNTTGGIGISVDSGDHLIFNDDNTTDIGAVGATRPRTVYAGTSVIIGDTITITTNRITGSTSLALRAGDSGISAGMFDVSSTGVGGGWNIRSQIGLPGVAGVGPTTGSAGGAYFVRSGTGGAADGTSAGGETAGDGGKGGTLTLTGGDGGSGSSGTIDAGDPGQGADIDIFAGQGGAGSGTSNNASGGDITIFAGPRGVGGSGAAGTDGIIALGTQGTSQVLIGDKTFASDAKLAAVAVELQGTTIQFELSGTNRWLMDSSGYLLANSDNATDIGAAGASRPRNLHIGSSINSGSGITPSIDNGDFTSGDGTRSMSYDASTGGFVLSGVGTTITIDTDSVTGSGNLTVEATATGGGDLTFGALGGIITLNEAGDESLSTTSFTATSVIGALNELKVDIDSSSSTLAETLAFGNTTGGTNISISAGDSVVGTSTSNISFPGTGASSEKFGASASAGGPSDVAIGNSATSGGSTGGECVAIGANAATSGGGTNTRCTAIGANSDVTQFEGIAIGARAQCTSFGSIAFGVSAVTSAQYSINIGGIASGGSFNTVSGIGSILIGTSNSGPITVAHEGCIVLGGADSTANGQFIVGKDHSTISGVTEMIIGRGNTPTAGAPDALITWRVTDARAASGNAGSALTIRAGDGDGAGDGGDLTLQAGLDGGSGIDGDLIFSALGSTITLNEAGDETLNAFFATTSLVGALNELGSLTPRQEIISLDPTELPIGTSDGDTTLANGLSFTPVPGSVKLFLNRLFSVEGAGFDFTLSGTDNQSIIWQVGTGTAPDLDTSDTLVAVYVSTN